MADSNYACGGIGIKSPPVISRIVTITYIIGNQAQEPQYLLIVSYYGIIA
jgi:hypothetical protein